MIIELEIRMKVEFEAGSCPSQRERRRKCIGGRAA
jgi:hypothetical protein